MNVSESRSGDTLVLSAVGRIDHETAEAFRKALEPRLSNCSAAGDRVVLDLGGVDYISSVGLRVLLMASKRVAKQNGKIAVAAMQPTVAEVYRISRFDAILPSFDTVEAAEHGLNV